eukprot:3604854-Pyramimonas_sp.AAC.1
MVWSGGKDGHFLQDLSSYSRTVGDKRRDIPSSTLLMLSKVPFKQGPDFILSAVKCCLVAPEALCKDGVAKIFTSSDFAGIGTAGKLVANATRVVAD